MRGYLPAITNTLVVAWSVVLAMVCLLAPPALCQTEVLNELYGSGVHAYNSGSFRTAYDDLTMAIRSGSRDPRVYYYRGLAYLRLGRPQEARADFNKAAALEMSDNDHFYPVSKSLERIQGSSRLQIERARANARLVAYRTRERGWYERYQRIRKNEPNVLAPPDEAAKLPAPNKPAPPAEQEPADEMPAEEPEAKSPFDEDADTKKPAEEMPAEDAEAKSPFDEDDTKKPADEMPAEKPEPDDPFGADANEKEPAEEMPAEKEGDAAAEESADEMPADKPAKPADDDPFADGDEKEPAEEMPAEKEGGDAAEESVDEMPAEKDGDEAGAEEMKDEDKGEAPADENKPKDETKPDDEKKPEDKDPFAT